MPKPRMLSQPTVDEMEMHNAELAIIERTTALEPLAESPALNRLLLKNARKSPAEISLITGIPVEEVAERLTSLLDNRSWRDDLMEEKLLLADVGSLVEDIRERMSRFGVEDEGWASMARVQLQAIKTMMEQMDKRRKSVDGQLSLVTEMQARLMGMAIGLAMDRAVLDLRKMYPDLDEFVIRETFENALPLAIQTVEAAVD